jgi:hypothetical protein
MFAQVMVFGNDVPPPSVDSGTYHALLIAVEVYLDPDVQDLD